MPAALPGVSLDVLQRTGQPGDFRVPDLGFHRAHEAPALYYASAALVVEVLSPHDETFAKVGFYAAHGVEELWVVDPLGRTVRMWQLDANGAYQETGTSEVLGLTSASVADSLAWPEG